MQLYHTIVRFLASGLGLGYMPFAPGTFGTLLGIPMIIWLRPRFEQNLWEALAIFFLFSIVIAHLAEKSFGQHDCQKIVIDEVAGVLLAYAFVSTNSFNLVLGFILFRLFDVAKIFPCRLAQDHLPGGLGVVADDLVAGLQAGVLLWGWPKLTEMGALILAKLKI